MSYFIKCFHNSSESILDGGDKDKMSYEGLSDVQPKKYEAGWKEKEEMMQREVLPLEELMVGKIKLNP